MRKIKNFEAALPEIRRFKCREVEAQSSYLLEDLTLKQVARFMGIGCVADPEEALVISQQTGVPVVGHSVWARCLSDLQVGRVYEGCMHNLGLYGLPELHLKN